MPLIPRFPDGNALDQSIQRRRFQGFQKAASYCGRAIAFGEVVYKGEDKNPEMRRIGAMRRRSPGRLPLDTLDGNHNQNALCAPDDTVETVYHRL